jgi:hypothetical protein
MKQTTIFTENKTIATPLIIAARISREKNGHSLMNLLFILGSMVFVVIWDLL